MHPVATYLSELRATRASGRATDELSHYGALRALLNAAGEELDPSVYWVMNPKGEEGSGLPDGAFFTPDQMRRDLAQEELFQETPSRGVMEVKGPGEEVEDVAGSEQVQRYLDRYGLVLVTNYRAFLLIAAGEDGVPVKREHFELAPNEEALWRLARRPEKAADEIGDRLIGHLGRALAYSAPLDTPEKLAGLLASYARDARDRLEQAPMEDLSRLRSALEEALGVEFREARGEHFFRSTVIQTLFYGLFSSWVLWHQERPGRTDNFSWHGAAGYLRVPIIGRLFYQLVEPRQLKELRLHELMNWATAALNRVQRGHFFARFEEGDAVQYFYEPFLEAFDPELRKELGVWYTPREVVRYQVARVDTALKEELGIETGLASEEVLILDPCCGTGAYLVEVLRQIRRGLEAQGEGALLGAELRKAATERVFGFEILTAPFVVAHLQLGLFLARGGGALGRWGRRGPRWRLPHQCPHRLEAAGGAAAASLSGAGGRAGSGRRGQAREADLGCLG